MGVKINYKAILIIETDKGGAMNLVVGPLIYDKLGQHMWVEDEFKWLQ